MAQYNWTRTGYGRTWDISIGTGTSVDLYVKKWPVLSFVKRPVKKQWGVYPRKLTIPIVDYDGGEGYLRAAVFGSGLECTLELDSNVFFSGTVYQSDILKEIGEDQYDTEIIVSDGLGSLGDYLWSSGTYTYTEFLREVFSKISDLDIHLYTDWDEDNAVGDLPDVNRFAIGEEGDTYINVLEKFCKTYGYQVYQEDGVWVVRSLAYFSADLITRWTITDSTVSSSVVSTFENLPEQYKSSQQDLIKGVGRVRSIFSFDVLEGDMVNSEFDIFDNGDFDGWVMDGTITQENGLDGIVSQVARINTEGDTLTQTVDQLIRFGDNVSIETGVEVDTNNETGSETAEWLEVIFTDKNSDKYWLDNDGTVYNTQRFLSDDVDRSGLTVKVSKSIDIDIVANGFPSTFSGKVTIICRFDPANEAGVGPSFNHFDHSYDRVEIDINSIRYSRVVSDVSLGSLQIEKIDLDFTQNSGFYSESGIEYYDGSNWLKSQSFGSRTLGLKRSYDEILTRNENIDVMRASGDFEGYLGITKLYSYDSVRYIPMTSEIVIGEDDVTLFMFKHEPSVDSFTENETFDNV